MSEERTKPSSVIYEFTFACPCGGFVTLSNRQAKDSRRLGSKTFWFRCSKCGNEGKASFVRETIYPGESAIPNPEMTPQEIQARANSIIETALEEIKEHSCSMPCSPGDWKKGGKCDLNGCMSVMAERQKDDATTDA